MSGTRRCRRRRSFSRAAVRSCSSAQVAGGARRVARGAAGAGGDAADRGPVRAAAHPREDISLRVAAVGRAAAPGLAKFARAASGEDVLRVRRRRRTGAEPSAVAAGQEGAGAGAALPGAAAAVVAERARVERLWRGGGRASRRTPPVREPGAARRCGGGRRPAESRHLPPLRAARLAQGRHHGCSDPRASYGVKYGFLGAPPRRRPPPPPAPPLAPPPPPPRTAGRSTSVRRCRRRKWRCMGG